MGCTTSYTKREWTLLVALATVTLGSSLCASLQAPFYPQEAERKGANPTEYGLVFGIFELTSFISCPIFGKYMGRLGAGAVLKCGTLVAGCSLMMFGLLSYVESHWWFISLSFIVRVVEGLGTSAVVTSSLSIVMVAFSDTFARVFTMIEIFQGLGFMVGPTVGGYLYEIGGFVCPFLVVGTFVFVNGLIIFVALPKLTDKEDTSKPRTAITSVLKIVPVLLAVFCMVVESLTLGFLTATLEPHLRQFELSPTALGGMFVISGLVYTLGAPLVGVLCDKDWDTKKMIMLGSVITIGSLLLIGPIPFTPLKSTLWLAGIGLFLDGLGCSLMFVPAFVYAIQSAIKYGLPDDITTYGLVSGIYGSSFSLGSFIGPSVGGMLFDLVGFRPATLFVISMHLLLIVAMTWFLCVEKRYDERNIIVLSSEDADATSVIDTEMVALNVEAGKTESLPLSSLARKRSHHSYSSLSGSSS